MGSNRSYRSCFWPLFCVFVFKIHFGYSYIELSPKVINHGVRIYPAENFAYAVTCDNSREAKPKNVCQSRQERQGTQKLSQQRLSHWGNFKGQFAVIHCGNLGMAPLQ